MSTTPIPPPPPVPPVPPPRTVAPPVAKASGPRVPSMEELVFRAQAEGASDIHIGVNERPRFRKRGIMEIVEDLPVTDLETYDRWLAEMLQPEQIELFRKNME
ncbi:MAG: hypothetical protein Q6K17_09270, partial [Gloeomargarita sp. GMQP_bins_5]